MGELNLIIWNMPSSAHAIYVSVAVLFSFYFKRAVLMQHGECARGGRDGVAVVIFFTLSFSRLFVFCFLFKNIIDRICFSSFAVLYLLFSVYLANVNLCRFCLALVHLFIL